MTKRKSNFEGVYILLGGRGSGKSAFATKTAIVNVELDLINNIYSNYKIFKPYNKYSKFLLLPFSKINDDGLVVDDIGAYEIISRKLPEKLFIEIMNTSDKMNNLIIMTGQDYTYFPPIMRRNAQIWIFEKNEIFPRYLENLGLLISANLYREKKISAYQSKLDFIKNEKWIVEDYYLTSYDTKETVNSLTTTELNEELTKILQSTDSDFSKKDKLKFIDYFSKKDVERKKYIALLENA